MYLTEIHTALYNQWSFLPGSPKYRYIKTADSAAWRGLVLLVNKQPRHLGKPQQKQEQPLYSLVYLQFYNEECVLKNVSDNIRAQLIWIGQNYITYNWKSLKVGDLNRRNQVTLSLSRLPEYFINCLGYFIKQVPFEQSSLHLKKNIKETHPLRILCTSLAERPLKGSALRARCCPLMNLPW